MAKIELTASAAKRIIDLGKKEAAGAALRLAVDSGGCSGFKYTFKLDSARSADDLAIERDGATLLIDPASLPFLDGSVVDFVSDLSGESFQVRNPMADSSCGCGSSFAVKI